MSGNIKENITRRSIWLRLLFMIILSMAFSLAELVSFAVIAFQFIASLFTGETNDQLSRFGRNLARYLQQITVYMTFASEEKPFPFTPWPDEPSEAPLVSGDNQQPADKPEKVGNVTANKDTDEEKDWPD